MSSFDPKATMIEHYDHVIQISYAHIAVIESQIMAATTEEEYKTLFDKLHSQIDIIAEYEKKKETVDAEFDHKPSLLARIFNLK
jgi:hypothetical protein